MDKIHGAVLRVLKDIKLAQPKRTSGQASFGAGRPGPFGHSSYIAKWWFSEEYRMSVRKLIYLIKQELNQYEDSNEESISNSIQNALQLVCMDNDIFEADFLIGDRSLFDRVIDGKEKEAAEKIFDEIVSDIESKIEDTVSVYLLPNISARSFHIPEEDLYVVKRGDLEYFSNLQKLGVAPKRLDIDSGEIEGGFSTFTEHNFDSVLLIKARGNHSEVATICEQKIRRFTAIVFAKIRCRTQYPIHRSYSKISEVLKQFVHLGSNGEDYRYSSIGSLMPVFSKQEFELPVVVTKNVRKWYSELKTKSPEFRNRLYVTANFVNLGMNAKNETSFILYFIALDAIYGVRGDVENSILKGVESMNLGGSWLQKTTWLYDLRNNLVHGGCSSISSWGKYSKYRDHFNSEPLLDIEKLCCQSLWSIS